MAEWFAHIGQQQYGPVDEQALRGWVTQGRLGPYDLIWSAGMSNWLQAASIFPGWFGQTPPPLTNVMPSPGMPGVPGMSMHTNYLKPHRGVMILIFGIIGVSFILSCLSVIFAIMAWVMGSNDLREIDEGRMDPAGRGITNGGRICGMIGTILTIIGFFVGVLIGLLGAWS